MDAERQPAHRDRRSHHCINAIDDDFSPWLATHDPNAIDLTARLLPPSAAHWFGTDEVGRDLFSRVLVGSQQSILAGLVVVAIAGMMGSLLGCLSGVLGGRADAIIMRIMDIMLSIPSLVLTMALAAALGPSLFNAMLAIAIVRIPFYVRLARGQTLVVRQYTFVQAAKTFGASRWHLINWHILRNSLPPLIVQASLDIGSAILMAATLGFIGLGAQQPSAEWGRWWRMVATMCSINGGIAHFRGQRFCLPPSGLISLAMVFAICLTRKQEESSHDPTRSGHSTTAFEFPRF